MTSGGIRVLKPNVTQEEALRAFSAAGLSALYWRIRSGPLQRIAEVYVPYFLFRAQCENARHLFAIDALDGSLDLFEFPQIPADSQFIASRDPNRLEAVLGEKQAAELLREKVLRLIFQQGFFRLRNAHLEISLIPCEIHLPYWLGFYGRENTVRCRVMDAVRRRIEGAKASAFFEHWLAA